MFLKLEVTIPCVYTVRKELGGSEELKMGERVGNKAGETSLTRKEGMRWNTGGEVGSADTGKEAGH